MATRANTERELRPRGYREPDFKVLWIVEIPIYADCVGGRKRVGWEPARICFTRQEALDDVAEMKEFAKRKPVKPPKGFASWTSLYQAHDGRVRKFVRA